jgi:hypothetical protein
MKALSVSLLALILMCTIYPAFGSTCMEPLGCARPTTSAEPLSSPSGDTGTAQHLATFSTCAPVCASDSYPSFDLLPPSGDEPLTAQVLLHLFSPDLINPPPRWSFA